MTAQRPRVIFNHYGKHDQPEAETVYLYGNDPVIQLAHFQTYPRTEAQLAQIRALPAAAVPRPSQAGEQLFGPDALEWAYQIFSWGDLGDGAADDADPAPVAPVTPEERGKQLSGQAPAEPRRRILLFNVIVALEWAADTDYLLQLKWALRRGSDFLYDATDGLMAFGQVSVGGPELMACADIQIMASNRLHPRSWVGGLLKSEKYQPIRMGRGVWHDRNRVVLPWDEPEGYRTIIHEWCHYALNLMDGYLESRPSARPGIVVVVPKIQVTSTSIMDSLEGTSELFSQRGVRGSEVLEDAWAVIAEAYPDLFAGLPGRSARNGPARLPLPLPAFHMANALAGATAPALIPALAPGGTASELATLLTQHLLSAMPLAEELYELVRFDLRKVLAGRCWVHLLRRNGARRDGGRQFANVIAQGTLDARAIEDGFQVFGAQEGDLLHLTFEDPLGATILARAKLRVRDGQLVPGPWERLSTQPTIVEVTPRYTPGTPASELWVEISFEGAEGSLPVGGLVVEQGATADGQGEQLRERQVPAAASSVQQALSTGARLKLQRLDGHVLLEWPDGGLTVSSFSHGGGPPTHGGISPVSFSGGFAPAGVAGGLSPRTLRQATSVKSPITAGSTDGRVMVFFEPHRLETDEQQASDQQRYYEGVRVVTTALRGIGLPVPTPYAVPGSSLYSLSSTMPIPAELDPTLVIYLDPFDLAPGRGPLIYCWQGGAWSEQRTEQARAGSRYVYISLRGTPLVEDLRDYTLRDDPRSASFRVYWAP